MSIVGSQANDRWEMKIAGPNGFERSYKLGERVVQQLGDANGRRRSRSQSRLPDSVATLAGTTDIIPILYNTFRCQS